MNLSIKVQKTRKLMCIDKDLKVVVIDIIAEGFSPNASRGFGAAIAVALADKGGKVAINYFSRIEEARKVRQQIHDSGNIAEIFQADVTDEEQVKQLCEQVVKKFGLLIFLL